MADIEYTPGVDPDESESATFGSALGRFINVVGALASLALIGGVGVWGYKLVMRDVSGVPVVRAIEGPMRVQPDNPGGEPADHLGLAVNTVAAKGTAAPTADRLLLAPRPVGLTDEDKPMGELNPSDDEELASASTDKAAGTDDGDVTESQVQALVDQLVAGIDPVAGAEKPEDAAETRVVAKVVRPEPLKPADAGDQLKPQPAVLSGPGLPRSLRPVLRPARAEGTVKTTGKTGAAEAEVDPASLPAGTRLAQLGAFESPEIARTEWDRLNTRFEDYLGDKKRVIQKASSGGRTFYRLRAMGFADLSAARRFCSVLVAEKADCIPVTTR